ncbi:ABC transporter substrate-binding protein [Gulosibacter sediminis]|uniref:ABC transporter substrate-binding protein n=1 Tax=Gulosibacter sediminis TaxID=1729695 RepID=UPI0024A912E5|nr:sugar ABC transporter substrate-binding protein [Gulosibacter sediminis]
MTYRRILAGAAAVLTGVALAGCSSADAGSDGDVTLTLRLWDENVATSYEGSIEAFEAANPGIKVELNVVPWDNYFNTLRNEVGGGAGDDLFWINGASVGDYIDNGNLVNITETLGADAISGWEESVVEQYSTDGQLWGVPQLTDGGSAFYVNEDLLDEAGVTAQELSDATWSPNAADDTLLPLLQKLTIDKNGNNAASADFDPDNVATYGLNAAAELQNIQLNFIYSNGGTYQDDEGNLTFTNEKTVEAYQYLVDLINEYHVAPPAEATNGNGDYTRDEFLQGNIAVFESGTYNLANVQSGAEFNWSLTEIAAGPDGKRTTSPGIIVAGNANSEHPEEQQALLEWLGSAEGAEYIGAEGAAVPAVTDARAAYDEYWAGQDVDTTPFFSVLEGTEPGQPVIGANFNAQAEAFTPILNDVFTGATPVEEGLQQAEDAANAVS